MTIDGILDDWSDADRLDPPGTGTTGYKLLGRVVDGKFIFAIQAPVGVSIGAGTTIWLNTDRDATTGYQIFGWAGGAEYNINFDANGVPHVYTGADGQNLVSGPLVHAYGTDNQTVEFELPLDIIGDADGITDVLVDVNNTAFLPVDYAAGGYTLQPTQPTTTIGSVTLDGSLSDWTAADRLDYPGSAQAGYEIYGRFENDYYIVAIKSAIEISANTTAWLNTDRNTATGYQIFGWAGGAEYNINFGSNLVPSLYTGAAGETLIDPELAHGFSSDHKVVEFAIPKSALSGAPQSLDMLLDINDQVFLPGDYAAYTYTIKDPSSLPTPVDHGLKIGIVYSETSANAYFSTMAYSQLFMMAQNQATMAGVPFDLLTEADLTNIATLSQYDALIFPSFRNVPLDKLAAIQDALTDAVYKYGVGLVTAGDFMTNDATGAVLPGDPYARMKTLLGLTREGGDTGTVTVVAGDTTHPMMEGYADHEAIHTYTNAATSWFGGVNTNVTVLAQQQVDGQTHNAVVSTQTGGKNIHFATEGMLADNNMLGHAVDWVAQPSTGPSLSLHMSRQTAIVASRIDMDQAMEAEDVNPQGTTPGIYDKLLPILSQWKQAYNFVGSYYIDIGNDPGNGQMTNWDISKPYYLQMLAMGNEIGSHSTSHPENTNLLTPGQIEVEFGGSKEILEANLGPGYTALGAAVPGMPETLDTARLIAQYYSYITGGASLVGAGYPGAMGYLSPGDTGSVYIAPNNSFDFTLVEFQGKTPEQAAAAWAAEWASLLSHSDLPVVVWPWHDYGPSLWQIDPPAASPYSLPMFTSYIQTAYEAGAEFVTLADLAQRISTFDKAALSYSANASGTIVTATVGAGAVAALGKFALDVSGTQKIQSVTNWYAYDDDSVFLARAGGTYTINLGASQDDVTHITSLASRAELLSVSGDGANLTFSVVGDGEVTIDLKNPAGSVVQVTGATVKSLIGDRLVLDLGPTGQHDVSVLLTNAAPTIAHVITDQVATEDTVFSFVVPTDTFADDPGDTLTYSVSAPGGSPLPAWLHFDPATRTFSGTPANQDVGTIAVTVTATDHAGASVADTFNITVNNTNDAPTVAAAIADQVASEDSSFNFIIPPFSFADVDLDDTLTYSVSAPGGSPLPAWLHFDPATRTFSGTPANQDVGTIAVTVMATDHAGVSVADTFNITVNNTNDAPTVAAAIGNQTAKENTAFNFLLPENTFADIDIGDTLTYTAGASGGSPLPAWLQFDPATRMFSGTPQNQNIGSISVVVTATDQSGASASTTFSIMTVAVGIARTGGAGNDTLMGASGPDTLNGGAGNDFLDGLGGADSLIGGTGNDTFIVDDTGDQVVEAAGAGTDTVRTSLLSNTLAANVEILTFTGQGAFTGTGNSIANTITGGAGNDVLDGGVGADSLTGGMGDDLYIVDNANDKVVETLNNGTDTIQSSISLTIAANVENLVLTGTANLSGTGNALDNQIIGNSGANTLDGGGGNDRLVGGLGNDVYLVDGISDTVIEGVGEGTDTIKTALSIYNLGAASNVENLTFTGASAFQGTGNALVNAITGGILNDTLDGGADTVSDTLSGGLGDDTYVIRLGDVANELVNAGYDTVKTDLLTYTLANNVEDLIFTGIGAFRGTGNTLNNSIAGGSGNDVLNGGAGSDTMNGGAGDDSYTVDNGGDVILDSTGIDSVTVSSGVTSYTLQAGLENLTYVGTTGFTAVGNLSDNLIQMGSGNDNISGADGNDNLNGGAGADKLRGEAGHDFIVGGAGADTLEGGAGNDTLTGGSEADVFVFDGPSGASTDRIMDFSTAQGDKLAFRAADYGIAIGSLQPDWFEMLSTATATGTMAHAEFIYNSATKTLLWDADGAGNGAAVALATFANTITLRSTDFLIL